MGKRPAEDPPVDDDDEQEVSDDSGASGSGSESSDGSSDGGSDSGPDVSDEEEGSSEGEEDEKYKEIDVDFEFFDPAEKDFLGLKALLHTFLDGRQFDCTGLVDTIIGQV